MSDKSRARAVQKISPWSYQKCLQWVRTHKALIFKRGAQLGVPNSVAAAELWKETEKNDDPTELR